MKPCFTLFDSCYRKWGNRVLIYNLGLVHQHLCPSPPPTSHHELQLAVFYRDVDTIIWKTATIQETSLSKGTVSFMCQSTEAHCPLHLPSPVYITEANKILYFKVFLSARNIWKERENVIKRHKSYAWTLHRGRKDTSSSHSQAKLVIMHFQWFALHMQTV